MKLSLLLFLAVVATGCSSQPAAPPVEQAPAPTTISMTAKSPDAVAHFEKGELLLNNLRPAEAAEHFAEALKVDPDFVLARAYHGVATPGAAGLQELESAFAAAGSLPEAERVLVQALLTNRRGDFADNRTALTRLVEIAPADWRAHYLLGQRLLNDQKYAEAVASLEKATELNANAGGAQNMLGYAALRQGDTEGAIAAFNEYVRILPQEPNPQDSLGEALVAAGRFKEAEAAFQKALEIAPQFWNAHDGIAYARIYSGDWAGGRQALEQAKAGATRVGDKIGVDDTLAAVAVAQRNTAEALKIVAASEKTEGAQPTDIGFVPVRRALILIHGGRTREALAPLEAAITAADSGQYPPGYSRNLRRQALRVRILAEAQMGNAAAAQTTSTALDQDATARPDDPFAQSSMHYGRGLLAVAQKDLAAARGHFDACSSEDEACKWQGVVAAERAGDKAGAATAREQLLKRYARDPEHLVMRSKMAPPPRTT